MSTTDYFVRQRPHQSLEALAAYHMGVITKKAESGVNDGITLDCMSLLIALAFQVEAFMNLAGVFLLRASWRERDAYHTKLKKLTTRIGLNVDIKVEPYATLEVLKQVRDQMAHAKPINAVMAAQSDVEAFRAISPAWYVHCEPKFAKKSFDHVCAFKEVVVKAGKLKTGALLSSVGNLA